MRPHSGISLTLLFCLVLASAVAAQAPANNPLDSRAFLLQSCTGALQSQTGDNPNPQAAIAGVHRIGFVDGLMEMNTLYQDVLLGIVLGRDDIGFFCLPEDGVEVQRAVRIVVTYLEAHPQDLGMTRRFLAASALGEEFPCKGNQDVAPGRQ